MNSNEQTTTQGSILEDERLRRWRLILGGEGTGVVLRGVDIEMDRALAALYESDGGLTRNGQRSAGRGSSAPSVARWLGDIRNYFPTSVVRVMQKDALDRFGLHELLLEPEMLNAVEPDVNLVANLISLGRAIPEKTKETARMIVRKVVDELMRRLEEPMRSAVTGALDRAVRNRRPRFAEIDWNRTIRLNLKNYQEEYRTVIPEILIGFGAKIPPYATRYYLMHRSEWIDGRVGRLFEHIRGGDGQLAGGSNTACGFRHIGRRPDGRDRRSGGCVVRCDARGRNRYQSSGRLLSGTDP